jgi:2-haloacid dehalogenase
LGGIQIVKLVAFDAFGTIFDVYSIAKCAEELFPGQGQALSIMWRDRQIEYTRLVSMADPTYEGSRFYTSFWDLTILSLRYCCERMALDLTPQSEQSLMDQYAQLNIFPDVVENLQQLKNKGIQTAILSNGSQQMLKVIVEKNHLTNYFDDLVSVDDVRHFKVMPQAYDLLLQKFSCQKEDVLFVSCNAWDVVGAGWFGLPTYWVNRFKLPFEKIGLPPTYQASDLSEILQYI